MKTQNKKKNISLRIASGMAVAALLSTCAISSTFAKYTTSYEASDSARVAYWGFNQTTTTDFKLFELTGDAANNITSSKGDKVIAPGSSASTKIAFAYTANTAKSINAPEVAYTFTVNATASGTHTNLDANNNFKWTLQKGTETAKQYKTVDQLLADINALSKNIDGTNTYAAGSLPDLVSKEYTVGWEWAFDSTETGANDVTDTAMGNATSLENVTISITITATQKD